MKHGEKRMKQILTFQICVVHAIGTMTPSSDNAVCSQIVSELDCEEGDKASKAFCSDYCREHLGTRYIGSNCKEQWLYFPWRICTCVYKC